MSAVAPTAPSGSTGTPPQPASLDGAAQSMNESMSGLQSSWNKAKASALEAKKWVEDQLEWVDKNDEKLHKFALAFIAVEFIWMGGPWTLAYFAIGYVAEAMYPEKIQEALDRIKTVWLKSRTMQFLAFAVVMLALPSYRWQIVAAIFGGYMSHYTTPETALEKDFVKIEAAPQAEDTKQPERPTSYIHPFYWPVWQKVFPGWFPSKPAETPKSPAGSEDKKV